MTGPIPGQPPPHQPPHQPPPYPQQPPYPPQQPPPPRQPDWPPQQPDWDPPTERHQTGWQQPVPQQTGWDEPTEVHQAGWQHAVPVPEQHQPSPGMTRAESKAQKRTGTAATLVAIAVGALVAVGLGVYGRLHEPQFFAFSVAGFSSGLAAKAWLATGAFLLALVQIVSAMILFGKIKLKRSPPWIGTLHRWSGRVAVLLTVPVAVHCLYALGFQTGEPRVLVHSLFGCFFYGAFVTKMLVLNQSKSPGWALPAAGGAVFSALVALWSTASVWFFVTSGLTF